MLKARRIIAKWTDYLQLLRQGGTYYLFGQHWYLMLPEQFVFKDRGYQGIAKPHPNSSSYYSSAKQS